MLGFLTCCLACIYHGHCRRWLSILWTGFSFLSALMIRSVHLNTVWIGFYSWYSYKTIKLPWKLESGWALYKSQLALQSRRFLSRLILVTYLWLSLNHCFCLCFPRTFLTSTWETSPWCDCFDRCWQEVQLTSYAHSKHCRNFDLDIVAKHGSVYAHVVKCTTRYIVNSTHDWGDRFTY